MALSLTRVSERKREKSTLFSFTCWSYDRTSLVIEVLFSLELSVAAMFLCPVHPSSLLHTFIFPLYLPRYFNRENLFSFLSSFFYSLCKRVSVLFAESAACLMHLRYPHPSSLILFGHPFVPHIQCCYGAALWIGWCNWICFLIRSMRFCESIADLKNFLPRYNPIKKAWPQIWKNRLKIENQPSQM